MQVQDMAHVDALFEDDPRYRGVDMLACIRTLRLFFTKWAGGKRSTLLTLATCLELEGMARKNAKTAIDEWTVSYSAPMFLLWRQSRLLHIIAE